MPGDFEQSCLIFFYRNACLVHGHGQKGPFKLFMSKAGDEFCYFTQGEFHGQNDYLADLKTKKRLLKLRHSQGRKFNYHSSHFEIFMDIFINFRKFQSSF